MTTEQLFARVYSRFKMHFYSAVFRDFEDKEAPLTTVETFCMEVIYSLNRPTVKTFAGFLHMSSPNAAYKINNLVNKGFLRKVRSDEDHREYFLEVTQKYLDYVNISESYVNAVVARVKNRMTDEEWNHFERALRIFSEETEKDLHME